MSEDILQPQESHWLALCLCTESNRRREWPHIAQVIYNRVRSPRYPDTAVEVILQPMQFSAFNQYRRDLAKRAIWKACAFRQDEILLAYAIDHAARMVEADAEGQRISADITPNTYHYWSPVSMVPKGRQPAWVSSASWLYTPEGIDPNRFVFAENVT
jgi:hypothetical protein